ncbi:hypothetical protein [Streptomyces sp. NPDC048142]|uniref:hypothetical protein n=1 Tax=Streptomyces sp. NPDC048142 TaxID=3365501 RepID=UPI00371E2673
MGVRDAWDGLAGCRMRVGSHCRVMTPTELPEEERALVTRAHPDVDVGALLLPTRSGAMSPKVVCKATARAVSLLQEPRSYAELNGSLTAGPGVDELVGLVLDGIVEIEVGRSFISGAAAYREISNRESTAGTPVDTDPLSRHALQSAAGLGLTDPEGLAIRLYLSNSVPLTPGWLGRFPDPAATERHLGLHRSGRTRRQLERRWRHVDASPMSDTWSLWGPADDDHGEDTGDEETESGPRYKLYVSPRPDATSRCFAAVVTALLDSGTRAWLKVARTPRGLLRPDKMVLYVASAGELHRLAAVLAGRLDRLPGQGVPFAARFDAERVLLSWGMDPPDGRSDSSLPRHSWRSWLTGRIAAALALAQYLGVGADAWRFALMRVRCDGVDPATWRPASDFWGPVPPGNHR